LNPTHKALRAGTAEAHDRVDSAFAAFDLTDRDSYAAFLRAHADVVLPFEAALDAAGAQHVTPDWAERKRGDLLTEDLAFLRDAGEHRLEAPVAPGLEATDQAALAGALYVLEGSRLGGRFLVRQVPRGFPRAYLDADQAPEKWRNLLDRLDTILYQPEALQSALAAAHNVFAAFERSAVRWTKG
jgi:heme oxygenase